MSRLFNFLNEEFADKTSLPEIKKFLLNNCKANLLAMKKSNKWIYKGDNKLNGSHYFFLDSSKRKSRKSAHTSNQYNLLFSELLPSWNSFPKRNKGVICSTAQSRARDYGNVFEVIPFDNTPIAICPEYDIWFSFKDLPSHFSQDTKNLEDLNKWLSKHKITVSNIKQKIDMEIDDLFHSNLSYKNALDPKNRYHVWWDEPFRDYLGEKKNFKKVLDDILNPIRNGFKITTTCSNLGTNKEVWFDGNAVLIPVEKLNDILSKLKV